MSRYASDAGIEGEYERGSRGRVLRNRLGILSKKEMDQIEAEALLEAQRWYLGHINVKTRFTTRRVCEMHRDWLGGIYEWAGRYRSVEVSKEGFVWPLAYLVGQNMGEFERITLWALTPCQRGPAEKVCRAMARVQSEFLLVHPFREGNGRLARWLTDLMGMQADLPAIDYGFQGKGSKQRREEYLRCVVRGYNKDYEPLADFLAEGLRRSDLRLPAGPENLTPRAPSK